MRRPPLRVWVWTAATLALVVVAALLWRGSDAAATESTTAAPAGVPDGTPAGAVSAAWTSATATSGDRPRATVHEGRVLVAEAHGVRALDVATGTEGWHYTRANAQLCDWTAVGSVVVAVFRTEDRCDEAVALSADTGVRAWTRNVNLRTDVVLHSTDGIVLAASPFGVVTLDPVGDNIRWRQAPTPGCRLLGADVGQAGVVVLQRCAETAALQLRLFDGYDGSPVWSRDVPDTTATLAGVDRTVAVAGAAGVQLFAAADGAPLGSPVPGADPVLVRGVGDALLVLAGGTLSAVAQDTGAVGWSTPATGLPGDVVGGKQPDVEAPVPVPEDGAVVLRNLATGAEVGRSTVEGLPAGGLATVAGSVVVLQLTDRVVGYR
ncbi:PQQ-binding-like beta-propeller repeat protein [Geodermatophilus sp. SYSU D00708]